MSEDNRQSVNPTPVKITFLPSNKTVHIPYGSTLLQAAISADVKVESTCGGRGTCGKCRVKLSSDSLNPPSDLEKRFLDSEKLSDGWVLACQQICDKDTIIEVSEQKDAHDRKFALDQRDQLRSISPSIIKHYLSLDQPSTYDQRSDWERLVAKLQNPEIKFNRSLLASLPNLLRQADFKVTVVLDENELIAVEPGDTRNRAFGVAIDIGTTTLVVYLLDLNSGELIGRGALTNPQQGAGADVIARITYATNNPQRLADLQEKVILGLNELLTQLCQKHKVSLREIYQMVVVGNTTMSHFFLGIDPTYLAPAPFVPAFRQMVSVKASELGFEILGTANVTVLPIVAGYVGSDTVGVMLAAEVDRLEGVHILVDIGTNGEIVLVGKGRILTCSTAAGPAFEGAGIKHGMRAADGAIERVRISSDVELGIIGEGKACGLCGSGLIDAISEMHKAGIIDSTGRMVSSDTQLNLLPQTLRDRLRGEAGNREFVLVEQAATAKHEDITISQKDIRELQLAKGAILAGIRILLNKLSLSTDEVDQILLAGAFGNYIQKEAALGIGLLPSVPKEKIISIGNAAGHGAQRVLLSRDEKKRAEQLATLAEHVELSTQKEFQDEFLDALTLSI